MNSNYFILSKTLNSKYLKFNFWRLFKFSSRKTERHQRSFHGNQMSGGFRVNQKSQSKPHGLIALRANKSEIGFFTRTRPVKKPVVFFKLLLLINVQMKDFISMNNTKFKKTGFNVVIFLKTFFLLTQRKSFLLSLE